MSAKRKRSKQRRQDAPAQAAQTGGRRSAAAPRTREPKPAPRPVRAETKPSRPPRERAVVAVAAEAPLDRTAWLTAGLVGLVALVAYFLTVDPSLPNGDSGDLITSAYVLGVAHPPGYPLLTLLGHLATLLPGGSPALRVNLLSCLFDAAAVAVVFLTVYRSVGRTALAGRGRWPAFVAGAVGALLLAFSSLFWAYSVVAEVFALNNLFAALLLLLGLEWCRRPERTRLLWAFALVLGLALTNQQTIVLLAPAFAVLGWAGWSALRRGGARHRVSLRDLGIAGGLFVAGLLPYLYLPLAASGDPVMNWGNPSSLGRFLDVVTRANYGSTSLTAGGEHGSIGEQISLFSKSLGGAFVVVGLVLAALGLWWSWRHARAEGVALLVAFLVTGPIFLVYANPAYPDELTKGVVERFYILPSIPVALLAGLGAWWVLLEAARLRWAPGRPGLVVAVVAAALLVVPAAAAVVHYDSADQSDNYVGFHYAEDLLDSVAPNAILLMRGDENFTTVAYAQNVEHVRPDVVALDTELLKLPNYVAKAKRDHPDVVIPFTKYDGGRATSLNDLVSANLAKRPVYMVGDADDKKFGRPFEVEPIGLPRELDAKSTAPASAGVLAARADRFLKQHLPTRTYPKTSWERAISEDYGWAAFHLGFALQGEGSKSNVARSEELYRRAVGYVPGLAAAYKNLGLLLHDNGGDPKEIASVWGRYLKIHPNDPQNPAIRAVLNQIAQGG